MVSDNVKDMDSKMKKAADLGIPVVEVNILDEIKAGSIDSVTSLITRRNIAPWDCPNVISLRYLLMHGF